MTSNYDPKPGRWMLPLVVLAMVAFTYLFVRETDLDRARQLLETEHHAFAQAKRAEWERKWREKYHGSYWRWLTARETGRAKLTLLRLLWFV